MRRDRGLVTVQPPPTGCRLGLPIFTCSLVFLAAPALAQVLAKPDPDSLHEAYLSITSLVKGGSVQPHWMQDGSSFWYAEGAPESTIIYKVDPEANTQGVLIDPERLRTALTPLVGAALAVTAAGTVGIGLFPAWFLRLAQQSAFGG